MVIKERVNLQRIEKLWMLLNIKAFMKAVPLGVRTWLAIIKVRPNLPVKLTHINIKYIIIVNIMSIVSINTISKKQSLVIIFYICTKMSPKNKLNLSNFTEACLEVHCWRSCTEK